MLIEKQWREQRTGWLCLSGTTAVLLYITMQKILSCVQWHFLQGKGMHKVMSWDKILAFPVLYQGNNLKISLLSILEIRWNSWDKETLWEIILQVHALINNQGYCGTFVSEIRLLYGMWNHIYLTVLAHAHKGETVRLNVWRILCFPSFRIYARLWGLFNQACHVVFGWTSW